MTRQGPFGQHFGQQPIGRFVAHTEFAKLQYAESRKPLKLDNFLLLCLETTQLWAISRISNAYSLRRGRRLPPTSEVKELQFVIVIVI
jgi:hypothetical protein